MAKQGLEPALSSQLLDWYDVHGRSLPWRAGPGAAVDPYRVWLSEIMLQQTTVQAVKPYFEAFITAWPTVEALAAAPLDDVLRAWAGLGYYARARNLHACAKTVAGCLGGRFPRRIAELMDLPGIGPYTAGAIAAIAYDLPHAAVDGNVERVISRLYAVSEPLPESKPVIRAYAEALVPPRRAGDFAQAMMDLGATICTPRSPDCSNCPWAEHCAAKASGLADELPRKKRRKPVPLRRGIAFWVERDDGAVLLRRRPEKGLLGGMMEVPSTAWGPDHPADLDEHAPIAAGWQKLPGLVEHTFTHFRLELEVLVAITVMDFTPRGQGSYRWVPRGILLEEALPTVMRKVVALASPSSFPAD